MECSWAGGFYRDASLTKSYRAAVEAAAPGMQLERIVTDLISEGYELGGERLKTAPRGVDRDHPRLELLRYKWLTASRSVSPDAARASAFLDTVFDATDDLRPLVQWAAGHVALIA